MNVSTLELIGGLEKLLGKPKQENNLWELHYQFEFLYRIDGNIRAYNGSVLTQWLIECTDGYYKGILLYALCKLGKKEYLAALRETYAVDPLLKDCIECIEVDLN